MTSRYPCQRQTVATMQAIHPSSAAANEVKILLDVDDLPRAWYNILPDLPAPFPPYLHPGTKEPVPPQAFEPLFPKELIRQEMSPNRSEPIPEEVREAYLRFGRPTPLYRASRLEAFLKTPARIYYKREDLSPVGSHKPNTAIAQDPNHPGSLGVAISEAIETAVTSPNTRYSLGSVLNHVLMHQTVIGLEAQKQFELADITPDYMVGSVGGGSNFAGFTYPTIGERIHGRSETRFIAVEPTSVPSMTQGRYEYDFGDTGEMTPLVKMHTLGHTFVPPRIHAGGLRYHGTAATLSVLLDAGLVEPRAVDQLSTFQAGEIFAKTEGLIPAPETCHAIRGAIDLALDAKKKDEETVIAFNYSGHGLLDIEGYAQYLAGTLGSNGH